MPMGAPPQPTSETRRPVRPSCRYCIARSLPDQVQSSKFKGELSGELRHDNLVILDAGHVYDEVVDFDAPGGVRVGDEEAHRGGLAGASGEAQAELLPADGQDLATGAMPDVGVAQVDQVDLQIAV